MTRIPMVAWLSRDFEQSHPDRAKALRVNSKAIWTNDLLYDLVLGLAGVQTEHYDAGYDLSSSTFRLDPSAALTLNGARKVIDDPELLQNHTTFLQAATNETSELARPPGQ